jgi:hypothetical protein
MGKAAAVDNRPRQAAYRSQKRLYPYRQRFALAFGRFAMIDDGLDSQLVPCSPSLETQLCRHVSGVARDDGGIE